MASADVPAPALPIPATPARVVSCCLPRHPGCAQGSPRVGTGVARGTGDGVTSFARPLGGYQTTPHYPESARREGAEGVVTLRFEVLTSGKVGTVQVQRSAGRPDLDRAAVEAIRTWLFEPARRGKEAVAVWVIVAGTLRAARPLTAAAPAGRVRWDRRGARLLRHRHRRDRPGPGHLGRSGVRALPPGRRGHGPEGLRQGERVDRAGHRPAAHACARLLPARSGRDVPVALGQTRRPRSAKVVELYPGSFAGHRDLGGAYEQLNRVDDAARAYEAAIALRDQDDLRIRLAFLLIKANQQARALIQLQTLAERDSKAPEVWATLGRLAYEKNDLPARREELRPRRRAARRGARVVQPGRGAHASERPAGGAPGVRARRPAQRDARARAEGDGEGPRGHEGPEHRHRARPARCRAAPRASRSPAATSAMHVAAVVPAPPRVRSGLPSGLAERCAATPPVARPKLRPRWSPREARRIAGSACARTSGRSPAPPTWASSGS